MLWDDDQRVDLLGNPFISYLYTCSMNTLKGYYGMSLSMDYGEDRGIWLICQQGGFPICSFRTWKNIFSLLFRNPNKNGGEAESTTQTAKCFMKVVSDRFSISSNNVFYTIPRCVILEDPLLNHTSHNSLCVIPRSDMNELRSIERRRLVQRHFQDLLWIWVLPIPKKVVISIRSEVFKAFCMNGSGQMAWVKMMSKRFPHNFEQVLGLWTFFDGKIGDRNSMKVVCSYRDLTYSNERFIALLFRSDFWGHR